MPVSPPGEETNSCRKAGITERAVGPGTSARTGRSRQPRTVRFSSAAIRSIVRTAVSHACGSVGRKAMPAAYAPGSGSVKSTTCRNRVSGIWVRMPAPSPVSGSLPLAPRWSRLHSATRALVTIS